MNPLAKLETLNRADLEKQRKEAQERLQEIEKAQADYNGRRVKELRSEIEEMIRKEGFTFEDLFGGRGAKRGGGGRVSKGRPKYRHPENPEMTWSGRGRQPNWYKDAIEAGKSPEDMEV